MTKFEIGKTYVGRFACQYDSAVSFTVASRTEKTITTTEGKRRKIHSAPDAEWVRVGSYSTAPVVSADRELVEEEI